MGGFERVMQLHRYVSESTIFLLQCPSFLTTYTAPYLGVYLHANVYLSTGCCSAEGGKLVLTIGMSAVWFKFEVVSALLFPPENNVTL